MKLSFLNIEQLSRDIAIQIGVNLDNLIQGRFPINDHNKFYIY